MDHALADDLAQETFIKAFKQLHTFKKEAKFSSWLYRIGYNTFLEFARKKKVDTVAIDDDFDRSQQQGFYDSDPEASVDASEQSGLEQRVAQLLSALEPERRSVLHLLLHRQMTQQEIATVMAIPLGTVKTHITRGRLQLQAGLADWKAA